MKNYALLLCCWLLPISVAADVVRLSEPVAKDAHSETFGTDFDATQPTLTLAAAVEQAGQLIGQPVLFPSMLFGGVALKPIVFLIRPDQVFDVETCNRELGHVFSFSRSAAANMSGSTLPPVASAMTLSPSIWSP